MLIAAALVFCTGAAELPESQGSVYNFDPALTIGSPQPSASSATPPVIIERDEEKTSVRLQTNSPLSPYLGAQKGPELSADERRLLEDKINRGALGDYHLEAGVGVRVEDKTSLNLGYRFHETPSLLGERRNDPLTLSGDLRVTFDLKVPFD